MSKNVLRLLNDLWSLSLSISEPVTLPEDVELKQELVMMSPPASDSGSGSPPQFSPYCVDSEPGSPLVDHEQVNAQIQDRTHCVGCF